MSAPGIEVLSRLNGWRMRSSREDASLTALADRPDSLRAILWALAANASIRIAKLAAALFSGSGAMLAEALYSIADSGNQLLLWGRHRARVPPSDVHPLGHGRAIYFWLFIVALLLFGMGGVASIYEGGALLVAVALAIGAQTKSLLIGAVDAVDRSCSC